ncbi:MAG: DEAD/DEAH box helicase [Atopobiaceae bacterium]|nr:DEAD/DEAH box helicase [Atopobiaceae bacterium]
MTTTFAELGLNEQILAGVDALGFTEPTPVQAQAIPFVLEGRDVVASAQTGTGKTAAFALPTRQRIMRAAEVTDSVVAAEAPAAAETSEDAQADAPKRRRRRRRRRKSAREETPIQAPDTPTAPLALVVTPTRELAQQIERVTTVVCEHTGQRSVIVMGGARFDRQIADLQRGCDLLVATPGRLIDLMDRKIVDLSHIQILVLDEADRMLDMGFWPSVRHILQALPAKRQNLLFSATIPPSIKSTIDAVLHDPVTVQISRVGETADTVEEHLCPVTQGQKTALLEEIIRTGGAEPGSTPERVLVFCRTKHRVDDVSKMLKTAGFKVDVMHADRRQEAREKALARFRDGKVQVLVATDVMSRGIDVSGIDAVVNYDVPMDPEDYVHRVGRTGRAGATGHAYTFVAPDEITPLREIEYFTHKLIPVWDQPGFSYDSGRIIPPAGRSTNKPMRTMFSGSRSRGRGPAGGRYGRHY